MALEDILRDRQNLGIGASWAKGEREGADLRSLTASTNLTNLQSDRYAQETPSYLRKGEAAARTAELANVQGEADLAAGVPGAKAELSAKETQLKAQQAQTALDQWPASAKLQYVDQLGKRIDKFNEVGLQLLQFSGSTGEAIQRMAEVEPEMTKDAQFKQWAAQYKDMPRDQALNAFKFEMQKYSSGIATTREKFQAEALAQDQKGQQALALDEQRGRQGLAEVQARAVNTPEKAPNAVQRIQELMQQARTTKDPQELAWIEAEINAIKGFGSTQSPSLISPTGVSEVNKGVVLPRGNITPKAGTKENPIKLQ